MDEISKTKYDGRERIPMDWDEVENLVDNLCNYIKTNLSDATGVYGIPRGGSVPAVMISHKLNLPVVEKNEISDKTLVVDDICDSGNTLFNLVTSQKLLGVKLKTATLFIRTNKKITPDYWIKHAENKWLQFPWELEEK